MERSLSSQPEPIEIVEYDPRWPIRFAAVRDHLCQTLGPLALQIVHVGSTAVPGLTAKPIIDVDVVISSAHDLPAVVDRLAGVGYSHQGDLGIPGREAFASPRAATPHHLYVCVVGAEALARHLTFRDFLRQHPQTARAYAELKRSLAQEFRADRQAYTAAKARFVEQVLAEAAARRAALDMY